VYITGLELPTIVPGVWGRSPHEAEAKC